jgi:hypothetical protein
MKYEMVVIKEERGIMMKLNSQTQMKQKEEIQHGV